MGELRQPLGVFRGTAMMLNIVLGAGLLTLPGLARAAVGDAALLVWLACAGAALPLLVVFAVLGRRHPDAGGLAAMVARAFGAVGRIPATLLFLGAVSVGLPAIALTGGHYAAEVLGGPPAAYAAGLIVLALGVNFLSAEAAARANAIVASLVLVFILAVLALGWLAVGPDAGQIAGRMRDAGLPAPGLFGPVFMMVFFAFTGWEVSANLGEEFRDPARDLPRAMAFSFAIAVALYLGLALVVAGAGNEAAGPAPFAAIFRAGFGETGARAVALVSVLLIFANLSSAVWAVSRMVYSAGRDGLFPEALARTRGGVPLNAVAVTVGVLLTVVAAVGLGVLGLAGLLAAAGQNFLLLYAAAAAALLRLGGRAWHRSLSLACLVLVAALLAGSGGAGAAYPAGLILAGLVIARAASRRREARGTGGRS